MAKNFVSGKTLHAGDETFDFDNARTAIDALRWLVAQQDVQAVVPCGWQVEMSRAEQADRAEYGWYPDSAGDLIVDCGAPVVFTSRGWHGLCGHSHVSGAQYYEEDEVLARREAGYLVDPDGFLMDGRSVQAVR